VVVPAPFAFERVANDLNGIGSSCGLRLRLLWILEGDAESERDDGEHETGRR
jgi:hypothetical protein